MDFHPWIHLISIQLVARYISFNVAMDFHPWIRNECNSFIPCNNQASMLPWIFIHGYIYKRGSKKMPGETLQCCHGFSSMDTTTLTPSQISFTRFNVAMDFHPWIHTGHSFLWQERDLLQCCHGFSSMDTKDSGTDGRESSHSFNVAMDFHPWIHNTMSDPHFFIFCFNVAMDFHPWIRENHHHTLPWIIYASMLPWIFIHGYKTGVFVVCSKCGHASMLPWIFIHGYPSLATTSGTINAASMLPWIFIHGYRSCPSNPLEKYRYCASMLPWIFIHGYKF